MMGKILITIFLLLFVAGLLRVVSASPYEAISESNNPVFVDSGMGSLENSNHPQLRFGSGGRIAILGQGGQHADENSAVAPYSTKGSNSIVDPKVF